MDAHLTFDIAGLISVAHTLNRVERLKITGCLLGWAKQLVGLPLMATLTHLDLSQTELTDSALKTILDHAPLLAEMNVANNSLTQLGLDALCSRRPPFDELDVRGNGFKDPHDWLLCPDPEWPPLDEVRRSPEGEWLETRFGPQPWLRRVEDP